MEHKVVMNKASILKRVTAFVIDIFAFLCLSFILSSILISPLVGMNGKVKSDRHQYYLEVMETGLFQGSDFDMVDYIYEDYQNKIVEFYKKYDSIENFNTMIEKNYSQFFEYDEESKLYVPIKDVKGINEVYLNIMSNDCMNILLQDQDFADLSFRLTTYNMVDILISIGLGGIIYFIVIPLILHNGQTLGKKLLQLYVVSLNGDYHLTPMKLVCRSLFILIGEIFMIILTFGLIPLISLICSIFTNNKQSLHDLIVSTTVVDVSSTLTTSNSEILLTSYASLEQEIFDGNQIKK